MRKLDRARLVFEKQGDVSVPSAIVFSSLPQDAMDVLRRIFLEHVEWTETGAKIFLAGIGIKTIRTLIGFCKRWRIYLVDKDMVAIQGLLESAGAGGCPLAEKKNTEPSGPSVIDKRMSVNWDTLMSFLSE